MRYCDDVVIVSEARSNLEEWERRIGEFLKASLRLALNERRRLRPVSDGVDFLGYIVRPDYLLVRKRVVGTLRERLVNAEKRLIQAGMSVDGSGRAVYPWPWDLLGEVRQWLNAYLAHLEKASSRRLIAALWTRFNWLNEYFVLRESKVSYRLPLPANALSLARQKLWFRTRLPGHVLMIQKGAFWEAMADGSTSRRIPHGCRKAFTKHLWESGLEVAWIGETGRRLTGINERALVMRWGVRRTK